MRQPVGLKIGIDAMVVEDVEVPDGLNAETIQAVRLIKHDEIASVIRDAIMDVLTRVHYQHRRLEGTYTIGGVTKRFGES